MESLTFVCLESLCFLRLKDSDDILTKPKLFIFMMIKTLCMQLSFGILRVTAKTGHYVHVEDKKHICPIRCLNKVEH